VSDTGRKKIKRSKKFEASKNVIAKTERVRALSDASLETFEQHKTAFISILRDAHKLSPKPKPLDQPTSWARLTKLAGKYHWAEALKQETMYSADRKARLRRLAKALGKARGLIDQAMQDDVGDELSAAWYEVVNEPRERPAEKTFKKAVAALTTLELAALRASSKAQRVGAGRPKGTSALPHGYILKLADIYLDSTEMKPRAGDKPFAQFVRGFLDAIGREGHISERHLFKIIENALTTAPAP
jgi:hypothetical protein